MGIRRVFTGLLISSALVVQMTVSLASIVQAEPDDAGSAGQVLINEIKLGGGNIPELKEYITLFNNADQQLSLEGWSLEYAKPVSPELGSNFCVASDWKSFPGAKVSVSELSGNLGSYSISTQIVRQLNDSGSGSLRLIEKNSGDQVIVHDLVGWGADAPCKEGTPTKTPSVNKSLSRFLSCDDDLPIDTGDNNYDFAVNTSPNPGGPGGKYKNDCSEANQEQPVGFADIQGDSKCSDLMLSELLPNPKSYDSGNEFIEIYNPLEEIIILDGCGITSGTKTFNFPQGMQIEPDKHLAFYDSETKITLANSTGGEIVLFGPAEEKTYSYPAGMLEDISWALIAGVWQATDNITPNAPNKPASSKKITATSSDLGDCPAGKFRNPATNRCKLIDSGNSLKPCGQDQYRNPTTNRCRKIASGTSLTPCVPGQFRNPATNRCKSTSTGYSLKPCKPGQVRNPATNRCKSTTSSAYSLKPCNPGQERNPDTNRCRKVRSSEVGDVLAKVEDVESAFSSNNTWWLAGGAIISAGGYGVWEWRRDIRNWLAKLKLKK